MANSLTAGSPVPVNVAQGALLEMIAAAAQHSEHRTSPSVRVGRPVISDTERNPGRPPRAWRLAKPLALFAAVVAAFAASACGGNATTSSLESESAATVQRMAAAALESADSVHVTGTRVADSHRAAFDVRFDGSSSTGALAAEGVRVEFTRIGDTFYVKTGRRGLAKLGASASAARVGAGRWLKLRLAQITEWERLSLTDLARQLTEHDSPLVPEVAPTKLDGKRVVVVSRRDGSRLYVADSGVAYPLRGDYVGPAGGRVEFTDYGADFRIAAPEHAVDVGALLEGDRRAGRPSPARATGS